jgi:uncharacterized membrane protein (UPF0182 family)
MSVKKMGSKLAQGVRQVMEQNKTADALEQVDQSGVITPQVDAPADKKSAPATVASNGLANSRDAEYKVLHPERVWPD